MDAQRFISSGSIEAYISGLASAEEVQELEAAMAQFPEVAAAVEACRLDMEQYVVLQAVTPPPVIKENLLRMLANEEETLSINNPGNEQAILETTPVKQINTGNSWRWIAAAATILLLGSLLFNYIYFSRYSDYKDRYEAMLSSSNSLASETQSYRARMEQMEQSLDIVKNPVMKAVKMPGTKPFPEAMATIYWNTVSKEVFLMVNNLPQPAQDKQYQLWAIVNGKPVDMGVFDTGEQAGGMMQKMKSVNSAEMFAVTLEKKGGSPVPTMDQMYVAGKI